LHNIKNIILKLFLKYVDITPDEWHTVRDMKKCGNY